MNQTGIEWCDRTWNPMTGCYGPGGTKAKPRRCTYCYARQVAETRTKAFPKGFEPVFHDARLALPGKVKEPQAVFVGSMTDMMGEWWDDRDLLRVMDACAESPHHTFLWLTKNPERYASFIWPANCWLGTTVTDDKDLGRVKSLASVRNVKRFLSLEPMLGEVSLRWMKQNPYPEPTNHLDGLRDFHQVILGGETGRDARPMHPDWVRSVRDQCAAAGVPFFFKSWGRWRASGITCTLDWAEKAGHHLWGKSDEEYLPEEGCRYFYSFKDSKPGQNRLLDGREHNDLAWRI